MENKHALLSTPQPADRSKKPRLEQYYLHSSTPYSKYGVPTSLNLARKVFLCHSSKDKEFVRFLYKELCRSYHEIEVAFFDAASLPKAEAVSMQNILEEARQSKLGVLVLTEDFFTHTQNAMLELEAFAAGEVKLLPLFLTMSVNEFKEKQRRDGWEKKWREWSAVDDNLAIEKWRYALDLVSAFSGLEYCKIATNQADYIDKVVKEVTQIIGPAIPFSKEVVCGKDRLCKIVSNMYKRCASKRSSSIDRTNTQVASTSASSGGFEENMLDVVGIYGFPGLGKTTLCECVCDFYFTEFNGKVCYVDLGSLPTSTQASPQTSSNTVSMRMQHMLSKLTGYKNVNVCDTSLNLSQVKRLLRERFSSMKDPVFLAIDNILPEWDSQEEAAFYLNCDFPKGSKIFITSRIESILENVTRWSSNFSVVIEYMPALEFKEARAIFVHKISVLFNDWISNQDDEVNECVNMCTIKRDWYEVQYHPLMLKSLAASIRWDKMRDQDWRRRLTKLQLEGIVDKNDAQKTVFNRLDINYTLLSDEAKKVFLDLALFYSAKRYCHGMYMWIECVYSHLGKSKMDKIILQLQDMCFIEEKSQRILNLVVDFGKYKAGGNSEYVVVEDCTHWPPYSPRSARTVSISRCADDCRTLDLRDLKEVTVLNIIDNAGLEEVLLSSHTCAHLRSLIVRVPKGMSLCCARDDQGWSSMSATSGQCSLQWVDFRGDVCFTRTSSRHLERGALMPSWYVFPYSLKVLKIEAAPVGSMDLESILGGLRNLELLDLSHIPSVRSIDVTTCTNLKELQLWAMPRLKFIRGFENSPHLEKMEITHCDELLALTIPADSKTDFGIYECESLERISICTMLSIHCAGAHSSTGPGSLFIFGCPTVTNIDGLSQYKGSFNLQPGRYGGRSERLWAEILGDLVKDAGFDSSTCKAAVQRLELTAYNAGTGLAGAKKIELKNAQHNELLISALVKAQPKDLECLSICCKQGGGCGCDENEPHFGRLPRPAAAGSSDEDYDGDKFPLFEYRCPQVRELASIAQWHALRMLILGGCTSVQVWPDFGTMTSLVYLDLSNSSLKEWPAGVLLLHDLEFLNLRGCRQLPASQLIMKAVSCTLELQLTLGHSTCSICSIISLREDLRDGTRGRCFVADTLDALHLELVAVFDRSSSSWLAGIVAHLLVEIMYEVWLFGEVGIRKVLHMRIRGKLRHRRKALHMHIRRKMRDLLCSGSFLSLPFRACSRLALLNRDIREALSECVPPPLVEWPWLYNYMQEDQREKAMVEGYMMALIGLMGIALVGAGSLACYNVPVDDDLRDNIINFLERFTQESTPIILYVGSMDLQRFKFGEHGIRPCRKICLSPLSQNQNIVLRKRVKEAVCQMATETSVAAELGEDFMHTSSLTTHHFFKPLHNKATLEINLI